MNQPLVSICISCYNHEKYVGQALESAISQTYPNTEILISDDGSTDRTREIVCRIMEEHPEKDIKTFFSETNTTFAIVEQMNRAAEGSYIAAFSGDDYWGETAVETYVEFMEEHKEYAATFSEPEIVCEDGEWGSPSFLGKNIDRHVLFSLLFCNGNGICAPSMFVRTEVWREMGGWRFQYRQLQDYEMWLRMLTKYEIHFFEKGVVPVHYRIHENNLSRPGPEVVQRDRVERMHLLSRIMEQLEPDFFVRAFKNQLMYPVDSEQFCLDCEKFMVLLRAGAVDHNSVVMYYFDHIGDRDFSEHIEKDYQFTRKDFHQLTGAVPQQTGTDEKTRQLLEEQFQTIEKQNQMIENLMQKVQFLLNSQR